jgi:rod shape-determining protein MreD
MAAQVIQPLNPLAWIGLPALACAAGSLILAAPLEIAGAGLPQPVLGMVCAFAWAVIRPSVLAPFVLVILGLFDDLLWGDRLGLWALALLATHALATSARLAIIGHGFWATGAWYLATSAFGFAIAVALTFLTSGQAPDLFGVAIQLAATGVVFWFAWKLIETFEDADVRFR